MNWPCTAAVRLFALIIASVRRGVCPPRQRPRAHGDGGRGPARERGARAASAACAAPREGEPCVAGRLEVDAVDDRQARVARARRRPRSPESAWTKRNGAAAGTARREPGRRGDGGERRRPGRRRGRRGRRRASRAGPRARRAPRSGRRGRRGGSPTRACGRTRSMRPAGPETIPRRSCGNDRLLPRLRTSTTSSARPKAEVSAVAVPERRLVGLVRDDEEAVLAPRPATAAATSSRVGT